MIAMGAAMLTAVWAIEQAGVLDGIPASWLNGVGVVGLVALLGIGFTTGRVYTRGQVEDLKATHQREIDNLVRAHERELADIGHDRGEWRAAHRLSETARQEERDHNAALVTEIAVPLKAHLAGVREAANRVRSEVDDR